MFGGGAQERRDLWDLTEEHLDFKREKEAWVDSWSQGPKALRKEEDIEL